MPRIANIQIRRDTAANWASTNPILAAGEKGFETDTQRHKIGDGTTAWNSLQYQAISNPATPINVKGSFYASNNVIPLYTSPADSDTFIDSFSITNLSGGTASVKVYQNNRKIHSQVYVAMENNTTRVAYSTDSITWTIRTLPVSAQWRASSYGNGVFVTAAYGTSAASSTDGITWTLRTMPASANWATSSYGNGVFVALIYGSASAASSTDGTTWTLRTMPANASWRSSSYGNGVFVTAGYNSTSAASSTDGITWTLRTMPASARWRTSSYGNGIFIAAAYNSASAASSTDGITWTLRTLPSSRSWITSSYGNGTFVAAAYYSTSAATSPNGITWTLRTLPLSTSWRSSSYGNGVFVLTSRTPTAATSTDGITWTLRTATTNLFTSTSGHIQDNEIIYKNNSIAANATINLDATDDKPIRVPAGESIICQSSSTAVNFIISGERYKRA